MNIFKEVKEAVSVKDAASFYGINVNRNGMCICPFHNDRHPSMKVDHRFHCFGCQEDGDVIDFVGKLFSLKPLEAATKLADDFHIPTESHNSAPATNKCMNRKDKDISVGTQKENDFKELIDYAISLICDFHRYWWKIREAELPDREGEWSDLFCTAMENINLATEWLKVLENGREDEKRELLNRICNR